MVPCKHLETIHPIICSEMVFYYKGRVLLQRAYTLIRDKITDLCGAAIESFHCTFFKIAANLFAIFYTQ